MGTVEVSKVEVRGVWRFTPNTNAEGTVKIECNKQRIEATWTATRGGTVTVAPVPTATPTPTRTPTPAPVQPDLIGRVPDLKLADDLLKRQAGAANFDQWTRVLQQKGDWFLAASFETVFPIPAGWTTFHTGSEFAYILFSKTGNPREEASRVEIKLSADLSRKTSAERIAEVEAQIKGLSNYTIMKSEAIDPTKGYVFYKVGLESGKKRNVLSVLARPTPYESYFTATAFSYEEDWGDFYPIIRAIIENWSNDGKFMGVSLPGSL